MNVLTHSSPTRRSSDLGAGGGECRPKRMAGLLAVPVEVVVDLARHGPRDALHRLEIGEAGAGDRLGGAEMQQQRLLAPGADAWHLVEHRAQAGLGPPGAVDRKSTRLNSSHSCASRKPSSA